MYLNHFNLDRHPFRIAPEDHFVYMSQQHSRAYVYMDSTIWSPESFVVISGEVGSGKTTLLKKLIRGLDKSMKLIHVSYTNLGSNDLFHLIALQAGMQVTDTNKITLLFALRDFLQDMARRNLPVVLAIDEAQALSRENLEDIRMLAGLEGPNGPMLRVILLGQPELRQQINSVPQLTQRIKLYFHISGLSETEVNDYLEHRLGVAGYKGAKLFDLTAVKEIHSASRGIPRLINKLCDGLMLCAYADERVLIDLGDLDEVRKEVFAEELGLPEFAGPDGAAEPMAMAATTHAVHAVSGSSHGASDRGGIENAGAANDGIGTNGTGNNATGYSGTGNASADHGSWQSTALDRIADAMASIDQKFDVLLDRRRNGNSNVKRLAKK